MVDGVSEKDPGRLAGRLRNNKLVVFPGKEDLIGGLISVTTTAAHMWGFTGEVSQQ